MAITRREATLATLLGAAGLLPRAAQAGFARSAFEAGSLADLERHLGLASPVESSAIRLDAPEIAEDAGTVPLHLATALPGVARLLVIVEKNPNVLSALFEVNESVEADVSLRVKLAESSDVLAVAVMADGRVLYARRQVKVTQGGCGG
jgi:sulfur-oxidizing protein SoxY